MDVTAIATGIIGTITGSCGLLLGILNYFRDKPNIQVTLSWDMSTYGFATITHGQDKLWGVVSSTNIGRRPVFFSHLHLEAVWLKFSMLLPSRDRQGAITALAKLERLLFSNTAIGSPCS